MGAPARPRTLLALLLTAGGMALGACGMSGCEAVLGTGDLQDIAGTDATTFDATPGDDDDDEPDASFDSGLTDAHARPGSEAGSSEAGVPEASTSTSPSCVKSPSRSNCGAGNNDDCCAVIAVPGGDYNRAYDAGFSGSSGSSAPAAVSAFALDKYEVSVGRFREYVAYLEDGGLPPADGAGVHTYLNATVLEGPGLLINPADEFYEFGWFAVDDSNIPSGPQAGLTWSDHTGCAGTYTATAQGQERLPMTCVTWYEAYAFCIWDGGYLPSEAEWEFAAAGGGLEREYPWGSTDPGTAGAYATFGCDAGASCATDVGFTSLGVAKYGHYDMMGNAAEWVLDDFVDYDLPSNGGPPCIDCLNYDVDGEDNGNETKVSRGGGFPYALGDPALYPPGRSSFAPDSRHAYLGMRCGRNPPP